jgi:crotonobetainyl-CoA:carnitine CoA-transferase CaiB-like acyl-CoA transferase
MADPHIRARGLFRESDIPGEEFTVIGEAAKVLGQDYVVPGRAPEVGEHTDTILDHLVEDIRPL